MKIAMEWIHESNADDDSVTVPVSPDTLDPPSLPARSDVGGLWYAVPEVQMIDVRSVNHWKSTGYADNAAAYTSTQSDNEWINEWMNEWMNERMNEWNEWNELTN